jgi:hypothetical protein
MRDFLGPPDDHRNTLNGRDQSWPTLRHQHIGLPKLRNDLFRRMSLPANLRILLCQNKTSGRTTSKGADHYPVTGTTTVPSIAGNHAAYALFAASYCRPCCIQR